MSRTARPDAKDWLSLAGGVGFSILLATVLVSAVTFPVVAAFGAYIGFDAYSAWMPWGLVLSVIASVSLVAATFVYVVSHSDLSYDPAEYRSYAYDSTGYPD